MPDVTYTISAEAAKALSEVAKVGLEYKRVEAAAKSTSDKSRTGADAVSKSLKGAVSSLVSMAAGYMSVRTAINLANKAYEDHIKLQRQSLEAAATWSQARATALEMRPGESAAVTAMVAAAAKAGGVPETDIWRAAPAALSAAKGLTLDQVQSALATSARYARVQGTGAGGITARAQYAQDIMRISGAKDAAAALGSLQTVIAGARGISAEAVAQSFVPAATGYQRYGDTYRETMGFMGGMSYLMGDVSGEATATGFAGMRERLSTLQVPKYGGLKSGTTLGRLQELGPLFTALPDEKKRKLLTQISRGAVFQGKVRGLLEGDEASWSAIRESTAGIREPGPEAAALVDAYFQEVGEVRESAVDEIRTGGAATRERLARKRVTGARGVLAYDEMVSGLEAAGVPYLGRLGARSLYYTARMMGEEPFEAAAQAAESRSFQPPGRRLRPGIVSAAGGDAAVRELAASLRAAATAAERLAEGDPVGVSAPSNHTE